MTKQNYNKYAEYANPNCFICEKKWFPTIINSKWMMTRICNINHWVEDREMNIFDKLKLIIGFYGTYNRRRFLTKPNFTKSK